ncbi:MAG: hypothetical protein LBM92_06715, partial [Opitutaceae bacterium]|nr:hypothetical protein [Opitutaceae bacterium]
MKTLLAVVALATLTQILLADAFDVGGRKIYIPPPAGYASITDAMPGVKRLAGQMIDLANDTLAFYIPEDSVPSALAGEIPALERYFILKVNKTIKGRTVSASEFAELRSSMASQNQKVLEDLKAKFPAYAERFGKNISNGLDMNFALDAFQLI